MLPLHLRLVEPDLEALDTAPSPRAVAKPATSNQKAQTVLSQAPSARVGQRVKHR